jgi:hypothetical protein
MKFNVGDKVSFLNEKLSGRIMRIINEMIYRVETDDGFEIDANEKELVLISKAEQAEIPSSSEIIKTIIEPIINVKSDLFSLLENDAVHFVSMPSEDMQVLTGAINFYLVNKTGCRLLFSFSAKIKNKTFGLAHGIAKPHSEFLIINKKRSDLIDWQNFIVQAILSNEGEFKIIQPLNKELPLLLPDLNAEFTQLKGVDSYSKTIKLLTLGKDAEINIEELKKKFSKGDEEESKETVKEKIPPRKPPSQHITDFSSAIIHNDAEIDLHIQHLVDEYKNLSNIEMLQIQLKKFRKEMDRAIRNNYHRITFIHGVGNGVLRTEIQRELRAYSGVRYTDAPFEKYGFGATEVILI